jgi:hypothetical protein
MMIHVVAIVYIKNRAINRTRDSRRVFDNVKETLHNCINLFKIIHASA